MRLDKYLTQSFMGTRKKVHGLIRDGRIVVNGKIVTDATIDVNEMTDVITCSGEEVLYIGKVYYMFNKPAGCITARNDTKDKTVIDYFTEVNTEGIFPVGRLDKDTEGLLLLTNDGALDHRLMSPHNHIEKTYFFWAFGELTRDKVSLLENGIVIDRDEPLTKPARVQVLCSGLYRDFPSEIDIRKLDKVPMNIKRTCYEQPVVSGYLIISEGRKHQVKRMLKAVGCHIVVLRRVAIGEVMLDDKIESGKYRLLTTDEVCKLSYE